MYIRLWSACAMLGMAVTAASSKGKKGFKLLIVSGFWNFEKFIFLYIEFKEVIGLKENFFRPKKRAEPNMAEVKRGQNVFKSLGAFTGGCTLLGVVLIGLIGCIKAYLFLVKFDA
ncbi:MAG: hypothetical protein JSS09_08815 [Verrucomicrobia bacterium]|nr:hypothetical protein [Verrucomicrobiota bacterium]